MQGAEERRVRPIGEEAPPEVGASSKEKARLNWRHIPFGAIHPRAQHGAFWLFHVIRRKEKRSKAIRLRRINTADLSAGIVADDALMVDKGRNI